jgi:hypothetical protein
MTLPLYFPTRGGRLNKGAGRAESLIIRGTMPRKAKPAREDLIPHRRFADIAFGGVYNAHGCKAA